MISLFLVAALFVQSCKKDDSSPNGNMTAKVDGEKWTGKDVGAQVLQGVFNLSGKASDGSILTITVQAFSMDTFGLYANSDHAAVWLPANATNSFVTNAPMGIGYVFITEINTTDSVVSGGFEFFAQNPLTEDTVYVSEGKFSKVPFTSSTAPVGDNTFSVKIDGVSWTPVQVTGSKALGKIIVNATDANASKAVGITMPDDVAVGEYALGDPLFGAEYGGQYNPDSQTFLGSTSGTLKITKHVTSSHLLEGTFSFEASSLFSPGSASLTAGSFSVHY